MVILLLNIEKLGLDQAHKEALSVSEPKLPSPLMQESGGCIRYLEGEERGKGGVKGY